MAQLGNLDGALDLIDTVIAEIERPDWAERHYYAEALRIKGSLLSLKGDPAGAERASSRRSAGRCSSRRSPGSCVPRPAALG
jgi:hypothetical protein